MHSNRIGAILLILLATSSALAQQHALVSIQLRVEGTKVPIANATLELSSAESERVVKLTSDKHGRVVRGGLRPGIYTLRIDCAGYRPLRITGLELKNNDRRNIELGLSPAQ